MDEFSHPAQAHKFKRVRLAFQGDGVEVLTLSREEDVVLPLRDGLPLSLVKASETHAESHGLGPKNTRNRQEPGKNS